MNTAATATAAPATEAPARVLVTMGAGKAVHIGFTSHMGQLAALCDGWGGYGARSSVCRLDRYSEQATCKRCIKNAAA